MQLTFYQTAITVTKQKHVVNNGYFREAALEPVRMGPTVLALGDLVQDKKKEGQRDGAVH